MTPEEWNVQFTRQAGWTRATRAHLYRRANLLRAERVLDVGSGTGAVTEELAERTQGQVIGVDVDPDMVAFANRRPLPAASSAARVGQAQYRLGDAHDLPFPDAWFDVTTCHFLLLWCRDPERAAQEMVRVTRPGGAVLVCAEPDYGGRIDYPDLPLGRWQAEALHREGADPFLGRKLRALFALPGVRQADVGVIPGLWDLATLRSEFEAEWALWGRSFADFVPADELVGAKVSDRRAIEAGTRLAFMPVFSAFVRV
jgi:SAM-dependent methyltransferase